MSSSKGKFSDDDIHEVPQRDTPTKSSSRVSWKSRASGDDCEDFASKRNVRDDSPPEDLPGLSRLRHPKLIQQELYQRLVVYPHQSHLRPSNTVYPFETPHRDVVKLMERAPKRQLAEEAPSSKLLTFIAEREKRIKAEKEARAHAENPRDSTWNYREEVPTSKVTVITYDGPIEDIWIHQLPEVPPVEEHPLAANLQEVARFCRENPQIPLVYLNRTVCRDHRLWHPYSFKIVPYEEIMKDNFFTMSTNCFTHIRGLEFDSADIQVFLNGYDLFYKLCRLRFIRNFIKFKLFKLWRKVNKWLSFNNNRELTEDAILFKEIHLLEATYKIRDLLSTIEDALTFFDGLSVENLTLVEFLRRQHKKLLECKGRLKELRHLIKNIIYNAGHSHLLSYKYTIDDNNLKVPEHLVGTIHMLGIPTTEDGKYRMTYADRFGKKDQCVKIASFVRLVDCFFIMFLNEIAVRSVHEVRDIINKHMSYLADKTVLLDIDGPVNEIAEPPRTGKPAFPYFTCKIQIGESNLDEFLFELLPPKKDFVRAFECLFQSWESTLAEILLFQQDPTLDAFLSPMIAGKQEGHLIDVSPSLMNQFAKDEDLNFTKQYVIQKINENVDLVLGYSKRYHKMIEHFHYTNSIDEKVVLQETDLDKLRSILVEYTKQKDYILSTETTQPIGCFLLDTQNITSAAVPVCNSMISLCHAILPRIGKLKVLELTAEVDEAQAYLDVDPITAANYVEYLEFVEKLVARCEEMDTWIEYIKELYEICNEFEITYYANEVDAFVSFCEKTGKLHDTVNEKLAMREEIVERFVEQADKDVTALIEEIEHTLEEVRQPWLIDVSSPKHEVLPALQDMLEVVEDYIARATAIKTYQRSCRVEVTRFELLDKVEAEVKLRQLLWNSVFEWERTRDQWLEAEFHTLNPDDMQLTFSKFLKNLQQLEKNLPPNEIVPALRTKVDATKEKLPVVVYLLNSDLKPRHWMKIEKLLNHKFFPEEPLTLQLLEDLNVYDFAEEIAEISGQASSEASLETMLKKVEDAWKVLEFILMPYKDAKDVYLLTGLEEVQAVLDESNINITTIASSRHVGPIKPRVDSWIDAIELFTNTLDEWLDCQTNWLYLEPIFSAPDIQRQLPNEAKLFTEVDKSWKAIMRNTFKNPLAMPAATQPGLIDEFKKNNKLLEKILLCLEEYLESKRVIFPRFYFLSNEELLEILAQTRNPHAVQPHLRKCFDAIAGLEFGHKILNEEAVEGGEIPPEEIKTVPTNDIMAMISPEGERISLTKGLKARGNVEDWLSKVEEAMFLSIWRLCRVGLEDYEKRPRAEWVLMHPSQIVLTISQLMWARLVHLVFDPPRGGTGAAGVFNRMLLFEQKNFNDLNDLAAMVRGELTRNERGTLCALITIDVHARDIISSLVALKVQTSTNFEWVKQLRYYWEAQADTCVARMSSARIEYGFEYLGVSPRLVITPLTDKCYLCLMGALQLDLGGAPAGPAGTGKTETTKDLAKSLAIQCVVFNCSEGLDYKMMGKFFAGLAQSGAWCCFDEFNRIDIEVLSVIAQQLITIRNAKVAKLDRFMFEGREIKLIPRCAAFITMNPGYAGRTELPDNLKSTFRPMSMMVPDYGLIAEVILYSEGFESSKALAQKMVNMYKLCSEQLSQQDHYDFGMRAVKSVLVMAGQLKRANPDINENVVLIRALRDSNLPKFLRDDATLFQGILNDLFPGVEIPEHDYGIFSLCIGDVLKQNLLQPEPSTFLKVIQLYETMVVRHGVMTVGTTGGGKTTVLNTLAQTLKDLSKDHKDENEYYRPVTIYTLNPKSITMGELYGEVNLATMEWKDGLLGIFVRISVQCTEERHQWVMCDGPVDAVWIENMNTVLDDNKMLCLANSERIKLTQWVHMLFEVQDLSQASPATVSRCGMVYIDPTDMRWMPSVRSWVLKVLNPDRLLDPEGTKYLLDLFFAHVDPGLTYTFKYLRFGIFQMESSKVQMICTIVQNLLRTTGLNKLNLAWEDKKEALFAIFTFAYVWGVGGNLNDVDRDPFAVFVGNQLQDLDEAHFDPNYTLWEVYLNDDSLRFEPWVTIVPKFAYKAELPFFDLFVPTIDTIRFGYVMIRMLGEGHPVLYTGNTGVGKSVVARTVLNRLIDSGEWVVITLNFSAQTSSLRTQEMIEIKLERRKRTVLAGPGGKRVVVFIDDVNMPKVETYGAQPPIELLRQFLDFKGFYDREKLFWKEIKDVVLSTACAPPGGGRNPLTLRFTRHFCILHIPFPEEQTLKVIFQSILDGFFLEFSKQIQELSAPLIDAAIDVYNRISADLLPTPAKSHYVFNLRDLSKCVQGVLQADPGTMREPGSMRRLFYHECLRIYHDRLINDVDKTYFYKLMCQLCEKYMGHPVLKLPNLEIISDPPTLLFGDFLQNAAKENRIYEEITDLVTLRAVLQEFLMDFNLMRNKDMSLIFFKDALEHTCRLSRILRAERGNGFLVGVGGMGKQSLTRLSSHVNQALCFEIELTRSYDSSSFHEDLRKMYFATGALNNEGVFLLTDTQIVQEEFLEDVNNILNSGDVPNLFEGDEYEKTVIATRPGAKLAGVPEGNREAIYEFFIQRVRANLHVVLCMSPVGDAFRRRCRMFPSLVNCCTIDWFTTWPEEALISVAQSKVANVVEKEIVDKVSRMCFTMHSDVEVMNVRFLNEMRRRYYVTPSSYLDLLKQFDVTLKKKTEEIKYARDRIGNGLKKLFETNDLVKKMRVQIVEMGPLLETQSKATDELMKSLVIETAAADEVRQVVLRDEAAVKVIAAENQALADDAMKDLEQAMPAMEAATKALEALNKSDITEVRVFTSPPKLVKFVMEAVCLLLGAKQDWASAKVVLGDTNFLKKLQEYDKDRIPESTLRKLRQYIDHPEFVPEEVAKQSKACKSLCMWVRAIDIYAKVFKVVEPKRKKVAAAEKELAAVMAVLRAKQQSLADVEAQIARLEAKYDNSVAEKQKLEAKIDLCNARLNRAGRLTSALADEQERWDQSVKDLGLQLINVVGDILVASASMAYLGPFTSNYRIELIDHWFALTKKSGIPCSQTFNLITTLADAYEIRFWNSCGLPKDSVSTENAIFVTKASRWPLMIDPQEQANRWIRSMEAENNLKMVKMTDASFMRILEVAVRAGLPVLIWEAGEKLDPILAPILAKAVFTDAGRSLIRLGDTDVEYDFNFKLYITTKLPNPHYLPEVCIQVTIVNFTVTPSGLEEQLLADVVGLEKPTLEKLRTELIIRINRDKGQLKAIEDKILRLLFASKGNILDDEELVETLNESKETSAVIASRLEESEITEKEITEAREGYRTVATRGSVLYFVVAVLADIDPMYQFSLKYFGQIFCSVIDSAEVSSDLEERLQILIDAITLAMYNNVSRGLFERHKLVFSFLLCAAIYKHSGVIKEFEWNFLLRGMVGTVPNLPPKPPITALYDISWAMCNYLAQAIPVFSELPSCVGTRIFLELGEYQLTIELAGSKSPNSPVSWNEALTLFERMMLIKCLKEEKLIFCITEYVKAMLGQAFVESPLINLNEVFDGTSNTIPLIFVLSTGCDPVGAFHRFAADRGDLERIQSISLGQGQGPIAAKMIFRGVVKGDWVFLQNCHLAASWMLDMEKIIMDIIDYPEDVHPSFRLFMSSMPSKAFPVSVLQNSIKITNEPPKGIRANLKRAFVEMLETTFVHPLQSSWRRMVFGLCFFHAVIQERKKFGPLGWNILYEFSESDRECALLNLDLFCDRDSLYIPWDALMYITGEVTYGGRVTDFWDQRTLKTILRGFFSPKILSPAYKYSESGIYFCPESQTCKTLNDYRIFIETLPQFEEPEIFGMHENANIAFQTNETNAIVQTIVDVQPREGGGGEGKSSDEIVYELAEGIEATIMKIINMDDMNPKYYEKDRKNRIPSLTTVLLHESERFNKLLKLVHSSLDNLKKAIKGFVVMSDDLEGVYNAFLNNQVPGLWSNVAYPSLKSLGSWTRDLELRLDFIYYWLSQSIPNSFWLSGFFFPQGFMTGVLQTHARKYDLPIDQLKMDFTVHPLTLNQDEIGKYHAQFQRDDPATYKNVVPPKDGVLVHGLFLDAAKFDTKEMSLCDPLPGELNPPMPVMRLLPMTEVPAVGGRYICPLYKTSVRAGTLSTTGHSTNFVIAVLVPSDRSQGYWILRGTALLTQLTD